MSAPPARVKRFGQGAIATPANFLTTGRILLAAPTLLLVHRDGATWTTFALWFILSVTDLADGWLARREGTTRSGAFLDPIADKLLVLGGLGVLVGRDEVSLLPVVIIGARELGVSVYRSVAGRHGVSLPARRLGKYKTFVQFSAVGFVLWPWTAGWIGFQQGALWVAVALTVVSGLDIVRRGRRETRA